MGKKIIIPSSKKQIIDLLDYVDGYIIGVKDKSVNLPIYFEMDEIIEITKLLNEKNKKVFISLNKNMHNKDIVELKEILKELEKYDIEGILYYDVALINIKEELKLNINLVFSQEHSVTNYETINYWNKKGATHAYLSSEITLHEIKEISEKANSKLLVLVFGYIPIFVSERKLITNYLNNFDIKSDSEKYHIYKEEKNYPVLESKNVTEVYTDYILNGIDEIKELDRVDYFVFNSFNIEEELFNGIIKNIDNITNEEIEKNLNVDKGFLYKETIYKVKNYG